MHCYNFSINALFNTQFIKQMHYIQIHLHTILSHTHLVKYWNHPSPLHFCLWLIKYIHNMLRNWKRCEATTYFYHNDTGIPHNQTCHTGTPSCIQIFQSKWFQFIHHLFHWQMSKLTPSSYLQSEWHAWLITSNMASWIFLLHFQGYGQEILALILSTKCCLSFKMCCFCCCCSFQIGFETETVIPFYWIQQLFLWCVSTFNRWQVRMCSEISLYQYVGQMKHSHLT